MHPRPPPEVGRTRLAQYRVALETTMWLRTCTFTVIVVALQPSPTWAADAELIARMTIWEKYAPLCNGNPSKANCEDGDMNLFSGLLCAAGISQGCDSVRSAMDEVGPEVGRWHRSPRRKLDSEIAKQEEKDGVGSFSPDMALGTELYLATTKDTNAARKWFDWLERHRPCLSGAEPDCQFPPKSPLVLYRNVRGWPRFCTNDIPTPSQPGKGCTVRPGDLANLASTRHSLKMDPGTATCSADLSYIDDYFGQLVDPIKLMKEGLPRLLDLSCGLAPGFNRLSAEFNKPGYSLHLAGVEIFLLRNLGVADPRLDESAHRLAVRQPLNPFFQYLANGPTAPIVRKLLLEECPADEASSNSSAKSEWAWERDDAQQAWKRASLWDCLFIGKLISN